MEQIFHSLWELVLVSLFTGILSAFIIIVSTITGFREWLSIYSNKFFHKLIECSFCLSFWICVIISIVGYISIPEWSDWIIVPVFGSVIARIFI